MLKTYCIASETNAVATLFLSAFFWAFLAGEPVRPWSVLPRNSFLLATHPLCTAAGGAVLAQL